MSKLLRGHYISDYSSEVTKEDIRGLGYSSVGDGLLPWAIGLSVAGGVHSVST